jgi:hypothetical protein
MFEYCPIGHGLCTNQSIRRGVFLVRLVIQPSPLGGLGVFADEPIETGVFVAEYEGKVWSAVPSNRLHCLTRLLYSECTGTRSFAMTGTTPTTRRTW